MAVSYDLGLFVITLCFVACLSADANLSRDNVREAVRQAKAATNKALENAQKQFSEAEHLKDTIESRKTKADKAASGAETAANGNTEAAPFAEKAKNAFEKFCNFYSGYSEETESVFNLTTELRSKARRLDNKADQLTVPDTDPSDNYKEVSDSAASTKSEAEALQNEIEKAKSLVNTAKFKLFTLSDHAQDAQVAKHQVDAIVTVAEIDDMLKKADEVIQSIEQKKKEVNATVQAMSDILKKTPEGLFLHINGLHSTTEGDLQRTSNQLKNAQNAREAILQQKQYAEGPVTEIKEENREGEARKKEGNIQIYSKTAAQELQKINDALETAELYAANSNSRKESAERELLKTKSEPGNKLDINTKEPTQLVEETITKPATEDTVPTIAKKQEDPVQDTTTKQATEDTVPTIVEKQEQLVPDQKEILQSGSSVKPTVINIEKKVMEPSENLLHQASEKPIIEKKDKPNDEKLYQDTQNVKETLMNSRNIPTLDYGSDSTITVSVSVFVALIASVVLH